MRHFVNQLEIKQNPLDRVDSFRQHLNSQQPTMETENNSKIAFLDTPVSREPAALPPASTGSQLTLINT